jgi:hypothetical protein
MSELLDAERWLKQPFTSDELAQIGLGHNNDWGDFSRRIDLWCVREDFATQFGFGVPSQDILRAIIRHSTRIVEIGSGTGFWARLLSDAGADIIATNPEIEDKYAFTIGTYFKTLSMEATEAVLAHPDRDVLCIWPCYDENWAASAIRAMIPGRILFYIGEDYGCTADEDFRDVLEQDFERIDHQPMPQFPGLHDELFVYRKT